MRTSIRTAGVLAALLATGVTGCAGGRTTQDPPPSPVDLTGKVRLVSYTDCAEMTDGLRRAAARNVTPWGFGDAMLFAAREDASAAKQATPEQSFSTTNTHEAGVDEPDLVKSDGDRVITVTGGVLRVVDARTRRVTGTLRLVAGDQAWAEADLLVHGDRALVLFQGGVIPFGAKAAARVGPGGPRYVLVDLSGEPRVLAAMTAHGQHVDARQSGSMVRLVVRSQPEIALPVPKEGASEREMLDANRRAVLAAPADAWLPSYEIETGGGETGGAGRTERVGCDRISHPDSFTGTSMLTVHTIDLAAAAPFGSTSPIAVAADGDTVYGTAGSLYVTSNPQWWTARPIDVVPVPETSGAEASEAAPTPTAPPERTEVHRFDVSGPGAPRYVTSGSVPGRLLNQYSLSEYDGRLRVATTSGAEVFGASPSTSESGVYVLDAGTLAPTGSVTGLGRGERIYSVRFMDDLGYVVTFRQTDPLYALDLRDPAAPKVTGELKITGFSAYLHPAGEGRLIGIGQEASEAGRALGTQISLFDVADPAAPAVLSRFHRKDSGSEAEWDPHAFLYWPATGLAVLPLQSWAGGEITETAALALRVGDRAITELGVVTHPKPAANKGFAPDGQGIRRSLVIGDDLWTLSGAGLKVSDAATLADRAWIPFG
ncbi:beta-propeller domain-containing protein [Microbispora sp. H10885]|uniref:beta-propeller domain-containing protein n=1 Tax=Microbispora sp. H10885 TaxID=2729110 RepID=UPI001602F687|nr:beta-propeller domain-containing protein [Microbispora sp. H10885]